MFGMLTLDELLALQARIGRAHTAVYNQLIGPDGPRIPVFSDKWQYLAAHMAEIGETHQAVSAEINRHLTKETAHA
jgi:hypothetical protein